MDTNAQFGPMVRTLIFVAIILLAAVLWVETQPARPAEYVPPKPRPRLREFIDPLYWLRGRT